MRAAKFFRLIWRINAVVILLASIAPLVAIVWIAGGTLFREDAVHNGPPVVTAAAAEKEHLHLNGLAPVEGTTALRADLVAGDSRASYSSKGDSDETRNVLTVEPDGRIVLTDPTALRSAVLAEHVTSVDSASLVNGAATIVCQRGGRYLVITADTRALVKLTEREIAIPQLR